MHRRARLHSGPLSYGFGIMFQTGGKPSTWFPPVRLVELYFLSNGALHTFNSMTNCSININSWLAACSARWLAGWLLAAGWVGWLAGGRQPGWLAGCWPGWLADRWLLAGSLARWPANSESYQQGFVDDKQVRTIQSYKKSRCPWDGVYLCTSIINFKPAVNRQPGFRRWDS